MDVTPGCRDAFRRAALSDVDALLVMQEAFYAEEGYPFDAASMRTAWTTLLSETALGAAWLVEGDGACVAYLVVTIGFSLEHRGRDAFIDELYVTASHRGRGLGTAACAVADTWCRAWGVRTLLLEVEADNDDARRVYERVGFTDDRRRLLKRHL